MSRTRFILLLTLMAVGLGWVAFRPKSVEPMREHFFSLDGNPFRILLPLPYDTEQEEDRQLNLLPGNNPGAPGKRVSKPQEIPTPSTPLRAKFVIPLNRAMHFLILESCSLDDRNRAWPQKQQLRADSQLFYEVNPDQGGGSGGTEVELRGRLELPGAVLCVTCKDQAELWPDPEWCIRYLAEVIRVQPGTRNPASQGE